MKLLKFGFFILSSLIIGYVGLMIFKGFGSKDIRLARVGLTDGRLKPCDPAPNCVCSVGDPADHQHHIAALTSDSPEVLAQLWQRILDSLPELQLTQVKRADIEVAGHPTYYLHCTHTSSLFGFVDDIEFHWQPYLKKIDIKSASRVGYSDLGANRKRVEKIMATLREDLK